MADFDGLPAPRSDWALFLDVDGTLVEIAETPESVRPHGSLPRILTALRDRLSGAVALISGRPLTVLDAFFSPLLLPAAGLHGLERRRADGKVVRPVEAPEAMDEVRRRMAAFAESRTGLLIEDKGMTVALHYRMAPERENEAVAWAQSLIDSVDRGLILQRGKMVAEIRPRGPDKGSVIESFMAEAPFTGRTPVFAGDDLTDEAGFAAVNRMGGHSVRVGDGATAATARIESVARLVSWLSRIEGELATGEAPDAADAPAGGTR
jgi:trehalose 6-phosphate phosphatase